MKAYISLKTAPQRPYLPFPVFYMRWVLLLWLYSIGERNDPVSRLYRSYVPILEYRTDFPHFIDRLIWNL